MPFQKGSKQNVKKRPSVAKSQLTTFFRTDTQLEQQEMQKISQIVFQHFVNKMIYHHFYSLCTISRQKSRLVGLNRQKVETSADLNTEETGKDLENFCPLKFRYSKKATKIWSIFHLYVIQ